MTTMTYVGYAAAAALTVATTLTACGGCVSNIRHGRHRALRLVDQQAGKCSLQSREATTAAGRKQLLKFVEDDDDIIGPGSLSKSS